MSEDFSRESTYLLTPNPKLATSLFPIDHTKSSLNVTPLIEPYFMNSPVSNSSTLNCVGKNQALFSTFSQCSNDQNLPPFYLSHLRYKYY